MRWADRVAMRQIGSVLLIVLGGIALVGGILVRYADQNLLDPETFAERAVEVLDDEGAQAEIADVMVNELEKEGSERKPTQRAVDESIGAISEDPRFRDALEAALVRANKQALGEGSDGVVVNVTGVGGVVRMQIAKNDKKVARDVPRDLELPVANTGSSGTLVDVARRADDASSLSLVLPILGGLLLIGGVVVANDRRTAVFGASMGVALAGVALFAGYLVGREIAARQPDDDAAQEAARAIWDAVFGGLETLGLVMAGAGALVAIIAGVANRVRVPGRA